MTTEIETRFKENNILTFNFKTSIGRKIRFNITDRLNKPAEKITFCLTFPQKHKKTKYNITSKIKHLRYDITYELELSKKDVDSIESINKFELKWYSYLDNANDKVFINLQQRKAFIHDNKTKLKTKATRFEDYLNITIPYPQYKIISYSLQIDNIQKDFKIKNMYLFYFNPQKPKSAPIKVSFPTTYLYKSQNIQIPFRLQSPFLNQLNPAAIIVVGETNETKEEIILFKNFKAGIIRYISYSSDTLKQLIDSIYYVPAPVKQNSSSVVSKAQSSKTAESKNNPKIVVKREDKQPTINTRFFNLSTRTNQSITYLQFKYDISSIKALGINFKEIELLNLKYSLVTYDYQKGVISSNSSLNISLDKSLFRKKPYLLEIEKRVKYGSIRKDRIFYITPNFLTITYSSKETIKIKIFQKPNDKKRLREEAYQKQMILLKDFESKQPDFKISKHNERLLEYNPSYLQVLSSSNNHVSKHHDIYEALVSIKYIDTNYKVRNKLIAAYWCKSCHTYFTFSESFKQQIHNSNIPFYTISTPLYNENHKPWKEEIGLNKDSVLSYYGYKVGQTHGKGVMVRHNILEAIVNNGILSSDEIINHLEHLIRYNGKRKNMTYAVQDWKEDINFLNQSILKRLRK